MKNNIFILTLFFYITYQGYGQDKKYLATATTNENIINYVHSVDSTIVLIDFLEVKKSNWKKEFTNVSGLLLSGGKDVNPERYSVKDTFDLCITDNKRDKVELFLIKSALQDSIPILGICRGHQIINVGLNGDLYQDIPSQYTSDVAVIHRDSLLESYVYHDIKIDTSSALYKIYKMTDLNVNSFHHQAVKKEGESMRIVARAPDGICEASEWSKGLHDRWIISVQFHPERLYKTNSEHSQLIEAYINACFD
jgi:putative glutamine amidotransferase